MGEPRRRLRFYPHDYLGYLVVAVMIAACSVPGWWRFLCVLAAVIVAGVANASLVIYRRMCERLEAALVGLVRDYDAVAPDGRRDTLDYVPGYLLALARLEAKADG